MASFQAVVVDSHDEMESLHSAPLARSTSLLSSAPPAVSFPQTPVSPLASSADARSRAMGNLSEALQRRRAKENLAVPHLAQSLVPGPSVGPILPKRDDKIALGLRAAVGSYKMKKRAPLLNLDQLTGSPLCTSPAHSPIPDQSTKTSSTSLIVSSPPSSAQPMHSQYLAARRESLMQRVGGHRRVVSDSKAYVPSNQPNDLGMAATASIPVSALPSLDQIRSWAALRKNSPSQAEKLQTGLSNGRSANSVQPLSLGPMKSLPSSNDCFDVSSPTGRKPKSLPIFAHAGDPAIPRICLSPDSDDEDAEDVTRSEPPRSAPPTIFIHSPLKHSNYKPDKSSAVDLSGALSSPERSEQRQALLTNLALARSRRSINNNEPTSTTAASPGLQFVVAPV